MAVLTISKGSEAVLHSNGTVTHTLAQLQAAGETVSAAHIRTVLASGQWTITRGATTVWEVTQDGLFDFSAIGAGLKIGNTDPITLTLNSAKGSILVVLGKTASTTVNAQTGMKEYTV
jgi:hypothetical protein